jgi:DNA-binding transcriptional ArsR family regulator
MQTAASILLPLLRSAVQADLLAWLYLHPETEYSVAELARLTTASQATVSREADRLTTAGFVLERRSGNMRMLKAAAESIIARPLTDLLAVTVGPLPVLTDALRDIPGIKHAHIYGSWAARYRGEAGPLPNDIDVLVIGDANDDELYDAAEEARKFLRREVNVHLVSEEAWENSAGNPFLTTVKSQPLVRLVPPSASQDLNESDIDP